ncbi:MAG: hypothetical protein HFG40_05230 [Bacilli bacterium]|nr:hypothetical protein [Bacilli bacterium]
MKELEEILDKIEELYNTSPSNEKHEKLAKLWSEYYKKCKMYQIQSERGYQLYLIGENESFIIDAQNKIPAVDQQALNRVVTKIDQSKKEFDGYIGPLTPEESKVLLDWAVAHTRKTWQSFGINVEKNSLNGLCELGQALSILPFEKIGFNVTKNLAQQCFGYLWNHAFGTVTILTIENQEIKETDYLVDTSYLQFFSTVRCNEGRYDAIEENTELPTAPDPGYFLTTPEEQAFAKELIENGYIELTEENARIYCDAFQKASILKGVDVKLEPQISAKEAIMKNGTGYALNPLELEEIEQDSEFPMERSRQFY